MRMALVLAILLVCMQPVLATHYGTPMQDTYSGMQHGFYGPSGKPVLYSISGTLGPYGWFDYLEYRMYGAFPHRFGYSGAS